MYSIKIQEKKSQNMKSIWPLEQRFVFCVFVEKCHKLFFMKRDKGSEEPLL